MDSRFLAGCESEQLHRSGAVLAHGALLVVDIEGRISHVSANIADWLGGDAQAWLGQPLPTRLASHLNNLSAQRGSRLVVPDLQYNAADASLDMVASRGDGGNVLIELIRHQTAREADARVRLPELPDSEEGLRIACDALIHRIAELTGFQRVMYYRFIDDGDGEVIAEARQGDVYGSYLGLRFPASDIPRIARQLYLKNPWRLIPDALAEPVPLLGKAQEPPDLTWSDLRSVSPVHRVYLANMGVRASLSFPVVVGGNLVALIACHHTNMRQLPLAVLEHGAELTRNHALSLASYQSSRRMRMLDSMSHRFDPLHILLQRHGDLDSAWPELGAVLMREFQVDGALLCHGAQCLRVGVCLENAALAVFDPWFSHLQNEFIWSGDSLLRQIPDFPLSSIAGVLAINASHGRSLDIRIYLCRLEHLQEVAWGGNPQKPVEFHDGELGIAPRRSFERWLEKKFGYSRPWDNESNLLALKLRELLLREIPH